MLTERDHCASIVHALRDSTVDTSGHQRGDDVRS